MSKENFETRNVVDITVKALMRRSPRTIFRLAGVLTELSPILLEDTSISIPELRADQVFLIGEEDKQDSGAVYLEYQLHAKIENLPSWLTKCGALEYQLKRKVVLLVLYLVRGDHTSFPDSYVKTVAGIKNTYQFQSVRLWEHLSEIENGVYPELAPLLVLCTKNPTLDTIRREIEIVSHSKLDVHYQKDLLSMILSIASRDFPRELMKSLFKKEIEMGLYDTVYDDWIRDAEKRAEDRGEAIGEAKGEAIGEAKGEAKGEARGVRKSCLKVLSIQFGDLPEELRTHVNQASFESCESLIEQALKISSISELDWRSSN